MSTTIMRLAIWIALLTPSAACLAQTWEAGVAAGAAMARNVSISQAKAGFATAPAFGVYVGQDVSKRYGGELRYTFRPGDLRLTSGGTKATFSGQSHLAHYDLLVYATRGRSSIRPFLAGGGGVRLSRGTGVEAAYQPLMQYALLTKAKQVQPVISLGAGLKFKIGKKYLLRAEVRDYISPFPDQVIAPASGAKVEGWLHDIVPLIGFSRLF